MSRPRPRSATAHLRRLIAQRARELRDAAIEDDARPTQEEAAHVSRLQQVLAAVQATERRPAWLRWIAPMAVFVTVVIVTALLALTVPRTEIELDVVATELAFTFPERQPLIDHASVDALGASGLAAFDAGGLVATTSGPASADKEPKSVRLSVNPPAGARPAGTIDLARWVFPAGARVWLSATGHPQTYRISVKGADAELTASVNGIVTVARQGTKPVTVSLAVPRAAHLQTSAATVVDFDLTLGRGGDVTLSPQLDAQDLSFARVDPFADTARQTPVRALSTVIAGTLFMESLNGARRELRAGQALRLADSRGEFRTIKLADGAIQVKFRGRVKDLSSGTVENPVNLMPTYFEWLRARQPLWLLWGAVVSVLGVTMALLRWWETFSGR